MNWYKKAKNNIDLEVVYRFSELVWQKILNIFRDKDLINKKIKTILSKNINKGEIKKIQIGQINNKKIYFVNGDEVKLNKCMDFTEGGHGLVYNFIPKEEIWLAAEKTCQTSKHDLLHELVENFVMDKFGLRYEEAHELANQIEKRKL